MILHCNVSFQHAEGRGETANQFVREFKIRRRFGRKGIVHL